jgi:hypothetical protein
MVPMTLTVSKIKTPKNVVHAVKNALQDYDLQKYKISTENHWFSVVIDRQINLFVPF